MINDLIEVERVPLKRMEQEVADYKEQKKVWQELNSSIAQFRDMASTLYGFQNPFSERVAVSSNESVLTATADRDAPETATSIIVKNTAKSDRFLSESLPSDYKIDAGSYVFEVGDNQVKFSFRGGSLEAFAEEVNKYGDDIVKASVIRDTPKSEVLLIESLQTGQKNRLSFLEDAAELGKQIGIIKPAAAGTKEISLETPHDYRPITSPDASVLREGILTVPGGNSVSIPVDLPFPLTEDMVLEMDVKLEYIPEKEWSPPPPPPGPELSPPGTTSLEDITIEDKPSRTETPEYEPPEPPPKVLDRNVLFLQGNDEEIALGELQDTAEFQTIQVPVTEYLNSINAINIRNRNTQRDVSIQNIRIYDPTVRGEYKPVNPISEASDAVVLLEGIEVSRDSNNIDDLIPGVSLNLRGESNREVTLQVEPDRELVKEQITDLIGTYNLLLRDIHTVTVNDEAVINEIQYYSKEEQEAAREKLGVFQGDMTLQRLRSSLRTFMMNAYTTRDGRDLALLAQMGIATNTRPGSGSLDKAQLRGYLEIDEEKLDKALLNHYQAVKDLFGNDSDGDMVVDSGLAYSLNTYVRPYTQTGGILSTKISTIDTQLSRTNEDIENYNDHLERYEQSLKEKYGRMEGALESLEETSRAIDNFSTRNSQNQ